MTGRGSAPAGGADAEEELRQRLRRHPADRYPVQHATARFHLGVTLAGAGRLDEAEQELAAACELFRPDQLPVEHAKAANARGAVLRLQGRLDDAARSFETAAGLFEAAELPLEQGAALFNLGLVDRERGGGGAVEAFTQARALLAAERVPAQAGAAARELGAALLTDGRPSDAAAVLEEAVALAARAGDGAGLGGASNVLGLAHLAAGHPAAAVEALEQAVSASPRSVRPDAYAMAKANLALAEEALARPTRARLAALQALGTPGAPPSVQAQAAEVVARLPGEPGAVWAVLDDGPAERWPSRLREELHRWVDADDDTRAGEGVAWVRGQVARGAAEDLAEAFLGILVELPPPAMAVVVRALLAAVAEVDTASRDDFIRQCSRAMARFPVPQWMRLKDHFDQASAEAGLDASW